MLRPAKLRPVVRARVNGGAEAEKQQCKAVEYFHGFDQPVSVLARIGARGSLWISVYSRPAEYEKKNVRLTLHLPQGGMKRKQPAQRDPESTSCASFAILFRLPTLPKLPGATSAEGKPETPSWPEASRPTWGWRAQRRWRWDCPCPTNELIQEIQDHRTAPFA